MSGYRYMVAESVPCISCFVTLPNWIYNKTCASLLSSRLLGSKLKSRIVWLHLIIIHTLSESKLISLSLSPEILQITTLDLIFSIVQLNRFSLWEPHTCRSVSFKFNLSSFFWRRKVEVVGRGSKRLFKLIKHDTHRVHPKVHNTKQMLKCMASPSSESQTVLSVKVISHLWPRSKR